MSKLLNFFPPPCHLHNFHSLRISQQYHLYLGASEPWKHWKKIPSKIRVSLCWQSSNTAFLSLPKSMTFQFSVNITCSWECHIFVLTFQCHSQVSNNWIANLPQSEIQSISNTLKYVHWEWLKAGFEKECGGELRNLPVQ